MSALIFLGLIGLAVVGAVFKGYALSILWDWFAVSQFGLPALNIPQAIGFALIVSYLTHQANHAADTRGTSEKIASVSSRTLVAPLLMLGVGWIVKGFL